jgi:hypothetical protein
MGNVQTKESRSTGTPGRSATDKGSSSTSFSSRGDSSGGQSKGDRRKQRGSVADKGGNGKSSREQDGRLAWDPNEVVDGGFLVPQGVYTGPQDFKHRVVRQLMVSG